MLAFVSTSAALLVPHFGRPAVPHPACRSAAVHMLDEADIPEAFKRKSKGPAPAPEILLVDREGDEVRFVMEGGSLRVYVANELFCGAIDTLTYSRGDGVVTVEDEVRPPHAHAWTTWRAHAHAHGVRAARALHCASGMRPRHRHRQEVEGSFAIRAEEQIMKAATLAVYGRQCAHAHSEYRQLSTAMVGPCVTHASLLQV